jgi:hypothetical protein
LHTSFISQNVGRIRHFGRDSQTASTGEYWGKHWAANTTLGTVGRDRCQYIVCINYSFLKH